MIFDIFKRHDFFQSFASIGSVDLVKFIVSESALAKPAAGVCVRLAGLSTLSSLHYC